MGLRHAGSGYFSKLPHVIINDILFDSMVAKRQGKVNSRRKNIFAGLQGENRRVCKKENDRPIEKRRHFGRNAANSQMSAGKNEEKMQECEIKTCMNRCGSCKKTGVITPWYGRPAPRRICRSRRRRSAPAGTARAAWYPPPCAGRQSGGRCPQTAARPGWSARRPTRSNPD